MTSINIGKKAKPIVSSHLKRQLEKIELKIEELVQTIKALENELAKPEVYSNPDSLFQANNDYEKTKAKLDKLNSEWAEIAAEIDN